MKNRKKFLFLWILLMVVLFAGSLLAASPEKTETIQTTMRDAVLHEENQISLFGWKNVNPGLISGMTVSIVLLVAAACIRIFVIPRFKMVPGRFQMLLEQAVNLFDNISRPLPMRWGNCRSALPLQRMALLPLCRLFMCLQMT